MKMKVKIFEGYPSFLEETINLWLKENKNIELCNEIMCSGSAGRSVITIFYEEEE